MLSCTQGLPFIYHLILTRQITALYTSDESFRVRRPCITCWIHCPVLNFKRQCTCLQFVQSMLRSNRTLIQWLMSHLLFSFLSQDKSDWKPFHRRTIQHLPLILTHFKFPKLRKRANKSGFINISQNYLFCAGQKYIYALIYNKRLA